jgi:hypothetical protein
MNVLYQTYRFNCSYAEIDINKDSPTIVSPLKNIASFQTNVYCPSTALWKQYDKDNDGVGDECDNCVRDPNKDQANTAAHLGVKQGDACNQDINHDGLPNNLDKDNGFCTFTTSCSERLNNGKYMYPDAVKKCWRFR